MSRKKLSRTLFNVLVFVERFQLVVFREATERVDQMRA